MPIISQKSKVKSLKSKSGQVPHRASRYFLCLARVTMRGIRILYNIFYLVEVWILKKARVRATAADLVTGQAMLIVVMVLGSTMLGVATIAGYVSLQKIRTSTEIVDSTKAIYAADSGVDWCLYKKFGPNGTSTFDCTNSNPITFSNDTSVELIEANNVVRTIGRSFNSYRAFGIFLGILNP